MTDREFLLCRYGWRVRVMLGVTESDEGHVLRALRCMGADVKGGGRGRGIAGATYSSLRKRMTLVIVGLTANPEETLDTFTHETMHAAMHIAEEGKLDPFGEEPCYIAGSIAGMCAENLLLFL